jgi:hypothetical protein
MTLAPTSKVRVDKKVVTKSSLYIAEDRRQRNSSLLRWMKEAKEAFTGGFARKSSIREVSEAHRFWPSKESPTQQASNEYHFTEKMDAIFMHKQ